MKIKILRKRKKYFIIDISGVTINAKNINNLFKYFNVKNVMVMLNVSDTNRIIDYLIQNNFSYFVKKNTKSNNCNIQINISKNQEKLTVIDKLLNFGDGVLDIYNTFEVDSFFDYNIFKKEETCKLCFYVNQYENEIIVWVKENKNKIKNIIYELNDVIS